MALPSSVLTFFLKVLISFLASLNFVLRVVNFSSAIAPFFFSVSNAFLTFVSSALSFLYVSLRSLYFSSSLSYFVWSFFIFSSCSDTDIISTSGLIASKCSFSTGTFFGTGLLLLTATFFLFFLTSPSSAFGIIFAISSGEIVAFIALKKPSVMITLQNSNAWIKRCHRTTKSSTIR